MAHSCISNISIRPPLSYRTSTSLKVPGHEGSCLPCCCVQKRLSLLIAPIHSEPTGFSSRLQLIKTCKLQNSCNSLRLGAAEEGLSSWEEKLESTSNAIGVNEGNEDEPNKAKDSDVSAWRDRIVDEEGNIDNIEQEYMGDGVSPCEGSLAPMALDESEHTRGSADHNIAGEPRKVKESDVSAWRDGIVDEEGNIDNIEQEYMRNGVNPCEESSAPMALEESENTGGSADHNIGSGDTVPRHHDHSHLPEHLSGVCDATFQNFSSTTDATRSREGPRTRTIDWRLMAETNHNVSSPTSEDWPGENNIREGDMGEANVGDVNVLPSSQQEGVMPTQFQEREKYGWSEMSCDEGSLSRKNSQEHNGGSEAMQEQKLEDSEEKVFREDTGRTPDDYHRRADLFGKSAEQFVARKHMREERESVQ